MTIPKGAPSGQDDARTQALQQIVQSLGAASGGAGRVYMGMGSTDGLAGKNLSALSESAQAHLAQGRPVPKWMDANTATNQYFSWTDKQRGDFRAKAMLGGLLSRGAGDLEAYSLWGKLVDQAALYGAQGKPVGPLDILAGYIKGNGSGGGWVKQGDFEVNPLTNERRYVGPQFKTTTASRVDLTDPATARAIATQVFQQLLGRDPGADEISAYASALAQSERDNPSRQTTTTQYDMTTGDPISTSTVSAGGLTADAQALLAQDEVKKKGEYAETQAATTYMNALQQAVGT